MCGIAGIFRFQGVLSPPERQAVERMLAAQVHRGPDDEGSFRHPQALLGHRRLSILDTSSAGRQPLANEDQTVQVVFNGEIYNFRDLRRDLTAAGHRFVSQTDTEVLAHGYEAWGLPGLLERLRGMFAFALLDAAAPSGPRLFLARDRFGIKPLYYFQDREKILFASEVRALRASGLCPDQLCPESLLRFLEWGSAPAPLTTIRNVRSLPAGHYLSLDRGPSEPLAYWDFSSRLGDPVKRVSQEEAVRETRARLEEAVRLHLVSDVPLGIFLSGGVDSSALAATASAVRPEGVKTLSVVFEEAAYNEAAYARRVADRYRTEHREILVSRVHFSAELPRIFEAMDQPTLDGVNTYLISKSAREAGLKVVLSGLGADELFAGYSHLKRARKIAALVQAAGWIPEELRAPLLSGAAFLGRRAFPRAAGKLWCFRDISAATPYRLARALFSPPMIARLTGLGEEDVRGAPWPFGDEPVLAGLPAERRMRFLEYQHYLQNQLLKDGDCMSMAHSIELRAPFMDHVLVDGIGRLPSFPEAAPPIPKRLLVEAMGPDFPTEVWRRPKQGFTVPFDLWLKQNAGDWEAMALDRSPLDPGAVREIWADFRSGRLHWSRAWATVVAARFYGSPSPQKRNEGGALTITPSPLAGEGGGEGGPSPAALPSVGLALSRKGRGETAWWAAAFNRKPRWVVLLTDLFDAVGGIPAFNQALVQALRAIAQERGWALEILVLHDRPESGAKLQGANLRSFGGRRWRFVWQALRSLRKADGVLFGHAHFSPLALACPRAQRWLVAHGIEVWGRLRWVRRVGLRRMDRILSVSAFTRDRLVVRHGVREERTVLFPNTAVVPLSESCPGFHEQIPPLKKGDGGGFSRRTSTANPPTPPFFKGGVKLNLGGGKVILTVSRLCAEESYKKIDRVIEAMPAVLKAVPDARHVIVGDGSDRPRLERLAARLGLEGQVLFMGHLPPERLGACYEACDVFVLPSLGEGFGIVFLEAMARGKACVGAAAGAVPEVIADGQTGLLARPDDAASIADAITRLLRDDSLRQSMGQAGQRRFASEFAFEHFKDRLERLAGGGAP